MIWAAFGQQWTDDDKVAFDGDLKLIYVLDGTTTLDIRADVWSAWVRWQERYQDEVFNLAMRRTGLETTPVGPTGDAYFLTNNWRLVVDFSKVRITGVLFSDNYDSAYFTPTLTLQYAAEIATIVNTVEIPTAVTATIDTPSAELIRDTILAAILEGGETLADTLRIMRAESAGKVTVAGSTVTFRDATDSKNRIVSTVDSTGQRTAVTVDGT
tara:strand:+ start:1706 stop:2344 length:639 start_codon:yes stop_codon:yes gene_type:complete